MTVDCYLGPQSLYIKISDTNHHHFVSSLAGVLLHNGNFLLNVTHCIEGFLETGAHVDTTFHCGNLLECEIYA